MTRPSGRSIRTFVHPRKVPAPSSSGTGILAAALVYWQAGFNVIPLKADKTPALRRWRHWQNRRQRPEDVAQLFAGDPPGVGIVTGTFGSMVALDVDSPAAEVLLIAHGITLPIAPEVLTHRGRHLWFRATRPEDLAPINRTAYGLELKGRGQYVVAPPSPHPKGRRYTWRRGRSLADVLLAPIPAALVDFLRGLPARTPAKGRKQLSDQQRAAPAGFSSPWDLWLHRIPERRRHFARQSIAGSCFAAGYSLEDAQQIVLRVNRLQCDPPEEERAVCADVADTYRWAQQQEVNRLARTSGPQIITWRTWRQILRQKNVSPGAEALAGALMDCANAEGRCYPGDHFLRGLLRVGYRKIAQWRAELVRGGLVAVQIRLRHPTIYRLRFLVR
ncbi:MAG: bifunctional DNA primase/polymerase [bacterium]|nr:bifunctional DNA primase/polymerase [bacterium]